MKAQELIAQGGFCVTFAAFLAQIEAKVLLPLLQEEKLHISAREWDK